MFTTALSPLYDGGEASDSVVLRVGWLPVPNQYSGRYMSSWKSERFVTEKQQELIGKM
jgi:hypothetical protein